MRYAPIDVLACGGLTIAMAEFSGLDATEFAEQLSRDYSKLYADDDLRRDFLETGRLLIDRMPELHDVEDRQLASTCKTLSNAIMKFDASGKKKRRGLFASAFFSKSKVEISDKPEMVWREIVVFDIALRTGVIPLDEV